MVNLNEQYDAALRILTFALTGCRDACLGRILRLAKAEYQLAMTARDCLSKEKDERRRLIGDAIVLYQTCDWPEIQERAAMYKHFLSACHGGPRAEKQFLTSLPSAALLQILDVGMSRISQALDIDDLSCAEIEAHHIHNIPRMLDLFANSNLTYYLMQERTLFETRLKDQFEFKHEKDDWQTLVNAWRILEKTVSVEP